MNYLHSLTPKSHQTLKHMTLCILPNDEIPTTLPYNCKISGLIFTICILICVICGIGCESVSKNRRIDYINEHSELSVEQKDLLIKGKLWVGMTPSEVRASIGNPTFAQKDVLGEKEIWSYMYKYQYTTHRDYQFDRVLRLEFMENRLANWRED